MKKKILQFILKILARGILKKHQPQIIAITGSIGKTSTKEAIYQILKDRLLVRVSSKNYNNEIGLPLTIIGAKSPGRNIFAWLGLFNRALYLCFVKDKTYPQILILEMGIDRPGDMKYLTSIAPPNISLVTGVSYSHLEFFGSLANIKKEKQVLVEKLNSSGLAILNFDNEHSREMATLSKAKVLTYGLKEGTDLRAQDINYNFSKEGYDLSGINFKLNYRGSIVPVNMKNVMAEPALYAALAAAAIAISLDLNLVDIAKGLQDYSLPKGRMNLIAGIKHSFLIDDTYNSSPEAALSAMRMLGQIKIEETADKYVVLGDMLEIGSFSEEGHRLIGQELVRQKIKYLVAVGKEAQGFIKGAKELNMEDDFIFHFNQAEEAAEFLKNRIKAGDVLLFKGSQGVRLEKTVKELMAEPGLATELLVRQGKEWLK